MKIVLTGSLGHVNKPLVQDLIAKGHAITVISSNPEKQKDIEALGAAVAIGKMEDTSFLASTFTGADVVYLMEPPVNFFAPNHDLTNYYGTIGHSYATAILQSGVKRIIHLSSISAHTDKGNGMLALHHLVESILNELPFEVAITFIRPVGFYQNMLGSVNGIKHAGVISSNYGGDDLIPWVSPTDIADVVAEEIVLPFEGRKFRYVVSDEITCNEAARVLGAAIGKPDLKWILIDDAQMQSRMESIGMNPFTAKGLIEMNAAQHNGKLFEHLRLHYPMVLGKVKIADFAKEFAKVYNV